MEKEQTIEELIASLNNSIEDIRQHPTVTTKTPSNFEIVVSGISDENGIGALFSPKLDGVINGLFSMLENGNFEEALKNTEKLSSITDAIFGEGSFKGPVSRAVIDSIRATAESEKFRTMKSNLGKTVLAIKRVNLLLKNLKRNKKVFDKKSQEYEKYKTAVYAIKQVLKYAVRIYRNRSLINKKVFRGLNNIVHEDLLIESPVE